MLVCNNISLSSLNNQIFNHVSFSLFPNSITYLKGSNGSGKSSLLRIIAGIQRPNLGEVTFFGFNINIIEKPFVNYIGHQTGVKEELTVLENLKIWAYLYNSEFMIPAALHYFSLNKICDIKVYTLSAGNKQKVALARLLCCQSDLWLLDEVDANLDAQNRYLLHKTISSKAANGGIVILTSHDKPMFENAIEINLEDFS